MLSIQRATGVVAVQFFKRSPYKNSLSSNVRVSSNSTVVAAVPTVATTATNSSQKQHEPPRTSTKDTASISNDINEASVNRPKNSLVAAVFETLRDETALNRNITIPPASGVRSAATLTDERISKAETIDQLLNIADSNATLTRRHALRIVSTLAEWSSTKRVKLSEFEYDARFLRLCRLLGKNMTASNNAFDEKGNSLVPNANFNHKSSFRADDLNTVLSVAGDDEAAKLIASISLSQMVKVMTTLSIRKRRSTPLLRSLAFNISSATEQMNLKQCADVLYAMATLNFHDSVLAAKLCSDIQVSLAKNKDKSAVIGSILTSLGILKHRDLDILEALTDWILKHNDICRPQDISALLLTSSILNFKSGNLEEIRRRLVNTTFQNDFRRHNDWLNHVWALTLIGLVENKYLESVLSANFIERLQADECKLRETTKMKLLNLNAYARIMAQNYKGPLLDENNVINDVPLKHSKQKYSLANGMIDALRSLLPANNYMRSFVNTNMGFLIDCECMFDSKRNPLAYDKEHQNAIKVAVMVVDYHDVCQGSHRAISGIVAMSFDLLEKSGYLVLPIPYNEFSTSDKLLKRVQYIEGKLKALIPNKNEAK